MLKFLRCKRNIKNYDLNMLEISKIYLNFVIASYFFFIVSQNLKVLCQIHVVSLNLKCDDMTSPMYCWHI